MARTFFEISKIPTEFWKFLKKFANFGDFWGNGDPKNRQKIGEKKFLVKNFELRSKFFTEIYDKIPKTVGFPTLSELATVNFWSFFGVAKTSDFIGL